MVVVRLFAQILLISLLCAPVVSSSDDGVEELLKEIPREDHVLLENFFRNLIAYESFGYVLFGEKPMAWAHIPRQSYIIEKDILKFKENSLMPGFNAWLKYSCLIRSNNFVLRCYPHPYDSSVYVILIINKRKILEVIHNNITLFTEKLGRRVIPQEFLEDLLTKANLFEDVFYNRHDLLGIVLGFGKHNSTQFHQSYTLLRNRVFPPPYDPKLMRTLDLIVEEIDKILFQMSAFQSRQRLTFIALPYFNEDRQHPESKLIRNGYIADQKRIRKIYSEGNFLKITLNKLICP